MLTLVELILGIVFGVVFAYIMFYTFVFLTGFVFSERPETMSSAIGASLRYFPVAVFLACVYLMVSLYNPNEWTREFPDEFKRA